jgi:hypothetical protein
MLSPLRNRFGIPGVISVIALVFAMLGGAYAANDSGGGGKATASAKAKKGPRGPKGATGAQGAQGPVGPQGPAGAKGDKGDAGAAGAAGSAGTAGPAGAPGKSVSVTEIPAEELECDERGGAWVKEAGGTEVEVCNGEKGDPWSAGGTLPVGSTETGTWAFMGAALYSTPPKTEVGVATISFPIPIAAKLDKAHVHFTTDSDFSTFCEGIPRAPTAPSGHLCVYTSEFGGLQNAKLNSIAGPEGGLLLREARPPGAILYFEPTGETGEPVFGTGSWAVTG